MGNQITPLESNNGNYGKFTWTIKNHNDENVLNDMLNAKNGEKFISKQDFKTGDITWGLWARPNGKNKDDIGSFDLWLKLISLPPSYTSITITQTLRSIETYSTAVRTLTSMCHKIDNFDANLNFLH